MLEAYLDAMFASCQARCGQTLGITPPKPLLALHVNVPPRRWREHRPGEQYKDEPQTQAQSATLCPDLPGRTKYLPRQARGR